MWQGSESRTHWRVTMGRATGARQERLSRGNTLRRHPELPTGVADPLRTKLVLRWAAVGTEVGISLVQI
jgi:hypothetical protein